MPAHLEDDMSEETLVPETTTPVAPAVPTEPAQATTESVKADTVNLTGNAGSVQARLVNLNNGGIGALKGEAVTVTVSNGGIGAMAANTADIHMAESGGVGAMAAREVTFGEGSTVVVAAAVKMNGNPKIMFDLRAGLLMGVVAGGVFAAIDYVIRKAAHKA